MKSFLDVEYGEASTMAVGGKSIELARAAVGTIAIAELAALDLPRGHLVLPI
jgi:hypothetical protein